MVEEKKISEKDAMKKKLIHNVIELVIWVVLLWMCYWYIETHPAEKISFFSWYKVIYQQTEIFVQNMFGNNWDLLKQKYSLESYYQALITLSEEKKCVDSEVVKDLQDTYEALQNESKNTLDHTLTYYIDKENMFDEALRRECVESNVVNVTEEVHYEQDVQSVEDDEIVGEIVE